MIVLAETNQNLINNVKRNEFVIVSFVCSIITRFLVN